MTNSWKTFSASTWCGSIFPTKNCWDPWRSSNWLARGQVNMGDGPKLLSPIHSTLEALVVWQTVGTLSWRIGPFCWPVLAASQFSGHLIDLLSILFQLYLVLLGFKKSAVGQMGSRPPSRDYLTIFRYRSWLWEVVRSFFLQCYNPIRNGPLLLHKVNEDNSLKQQLFFDFQSLQRHPPTFQFFTFSVCFKWQATIEWLL